MIVTIWSHSVVRRLGTVAGSRSRSPGNAAQSTSSATTEQRDHDEHDVAAPLHLLPERVEAHADTITRPAGSLGCRLMESLLIERSDGVVTCTLNRPEKKNAVTSEMWVGLDRPVRGGRDEPRRPRARDHRRRRRVLLGRRPRRHRHGRGRARRGRRARRDAHGRQVRARAARPREADDRRGQRCRRGRGLQPRARLRPRDRLGPRPVQRDLLEARPHRRLRRVVGAAPARRHAPGEGAGAARRRDRRDRGRAHRAREPRRRARPARRRPSARSRPASRTWRRSRSRHRSGC